MDLWLPFGLLMALISIQRDTAKSLSHQPRVELLPCLLTIQWSNPSFHTFRISNCSLRNNNDHHPLSSSYSLLLSFVIYNFKRLLNKCVSSWIRRLKTSTYLRLSESSSYPRTKPESSHLSLTTQSSFCCPLSCQERTIHQKLSSYISTTILSLNFTLYYA